MRALRIRDLSIAALALLAALGKGVDPTFECAWRAAALEYSTKIQPYLRVEDFAALRKSLNHSSFPPALQDSGCFAPSPPEESVASPTDKRPTLLVAFETRFHVGAENTSCNEDGPGSSEVPFCSISRGVAACRNETADLRNARAGRRCALMLSSGIHRLTQTIELTASDSGIAFVGAGPNAVVTGASIVGAVGEGAAPVWQHVRNMGNLTLWKLPTSDYGQASTVDTLYVDGVRAIQARFPNADPEVDRFPKGYITQGALGGDQWVAARDLGESTYISYPEINRTDFKDIFTDYRGGVGGQCSHFSPPFSYWCSKDEAYANSGHFGVPSGLRFKQPDLPHSPYHSVAGAMITTWRSEHWSNWGFEVSGQQQAGSRFPGATVLNFSRGGFQGARGGSGSEWFISNLPEELDSEREFWFNESDGSLLYVAEKNKPPVASVFERARLKQLFVVRGTKEKPVTDISFSGLVFTGTQSVFLDPHGVPSGGDWTLQRSAGLFFEGTERTLVENCILQRLDGNGIMLSAYNLDAKILHNTIVQTGSSAIALWGNTSGSHPAQPLGTGPNGTDGNFPRNTLVQGNFIHELGIWTKQSACFFQAKSAQTTLHRNICFDVPRAGFNINDGFGGGNDISENLLFQTCIESGDHAAINTWDRQAFITTVATGQPSLIPAVTDIHHNFIVSDGSADGGAVDNDDGSSHYLIHHNFAVYGGAKINNIGGHAQTIHSNVFAFPNVYGPSCLWMSQWAKPGQEPHMYDNKCVLGKGAHYLDLHVACFFDYRNTFAPFFHTHHNMIYAENSSANGIVSGCKVPPPPPLKRRSTTSCSKIFPHTMLSGWYEHDMYGLYGFPTKTAEECIQKCASYPSCSSGMWYSDEIDPGPTQPGTPARNSTWLCYLFHLPAVAPPLAEVGKSPGHYAFNCTQDVVPYSAPSDPGLDFRSWMAFGLDEGTQIAPLPSNEEIIKMGMHTLEVGSATALNLFV